MSYWQAWHEAYDDPASTLARRLEVVRRRLDEALDLVAAPRPRLLALCAGDGRDVVPVLARRPDRARIKAVLIELDQQLAQRAASAVRATGLAGVESRQGDAGDPASFGDVIPVDILMLCGIFGNVEHASVAAIAQVVPAMVAPGGFVIWTRGGGGPEDRRPEVRRWFIEAGMPEVCFDGEPDNYGVGVNQVTEASGAIPTGRLFTFSARG